MLKVNFIPLSDRVLIQPIAMPTVTKAGVILAASETNAMPTTGIIIAVGEGRIASVEGRMKTMIPMAVKVGDRVTWSKFVGSHVVIEGHNLLLMRESDIAGILELAQSTETRIYDVAEKCEPPIVRASAPLDAKGRPIDAPCDEKDRP